MTRRKAILVVCVNKRTETGLRCCGSPGDQIADKLEAQVKARGLPIRVERIECFGMCNEGPNVRIAPRGKFFHRVETGHLGHIIGEAEAFARRPRPRRPRRL